MENETAGKRWERTNTADLWKLASTGGYYARVKINGREKWKSLKTKLHSVAKLKLADFERAVRHHAFIPDTSNAADTFNGGTSTFSLFLISSFRWSTKRQLILALPEQAELLPRFFRNHLVET